MRQTTELGDFLQDLVNRRHRGSVRAAAHYIRIAHTTLRDIMRDATPSKETAKKIAAWAHVPEEYILRLAGYLGTSRARDMALEARAEALRARAELDQLGEVYEQPSDFERPVLGGVPAGPPAVEEQQVLGRMHVPSGAIVITVRGDSLLDIGIQPGDWLVVDTSDREPQRGKLTVVRLLATDETTVKRWYPEKDHVRLEPANSKYKCILATDVEVIGVVIGSWRDYR